MRAAPWRDPPLTKEEDDDLFMLTLLDDELEPTWSFGGALQFWAASGFAHSLRNYAHEHRLPWYVACMLPIAYSEQPFLHRMLIAPDTYVAFVPDHAREVFDAVAERTFPQFILEVVSTSSESEDRHMKRRVYELLGAEEYVLFTPRDGLPHLWRAIAARRRARSSLGNPTHEVGSGATCSGSSWSRAGRSSRLRRPMDGCCSHPSKP